MHTEYSTASSTCKAHDFHPNHEKYRSLRSLFLFRKYFSKFFPKTVDKRGHLWYSNPCQYPPVWWNGRHRRLKISRRKDCGFESHRPYHMELSSPCPQGMRARFFWTPSTAEQLIWDGAFLTTFFRPPNEFPHTFFDGKTWLFCTFSDGKTWLSPTFSDGNAQIALY